MTLVVVDATQGVEGLDLIVSGWVRCGLVSPMAWGTVRSDKEDWRVFAGGVESMPRNEAINQVTERSELNVIVVADQDPEGDVHSNVVELLNDLQVEFARTTNRPVPMPLRSRLMLVPRRAEEGWEVGKVAGLVKAEIWQWEQILVVSPEDSPTPAHGTEIGQRPPTAVAAHCLISAMSHWDLDPFPTPPAEEHTDDAFRMIRCWTRVIDAGFVLDHIGAAIPKVVIDSSETADQRLKNAYVRLRSCDEVDTDMDGPELPTGPESPPGPWRYLQEVIRHILVGFAPMLWRMILQRWLTPWVSRWESLVYRLAKLLRLPESSEPIAIDEPAETVDPLAKEIKRARHSLDTIATGDELELSPPANAQLWRTICDHVLARLDSGELSVDEATALVDEEPLSLLGRLRDDYAKGRDRAQKGLESTLARALKLHGAPEPDQSEDQPTPSFVSGLWRRTRRFGFIVFALGVAVIAAIVLPGVGIVLAGLIVLGLVVAKSSTSMVWRAVITLAKEYASRYDSNSQELEVERLIAWRQHYEKLAYRTDQITGWAGALQAVAQAAGQGPSIDLDSLGEFTPGSAPRAMAFASGVASRDRIEEVAAAIRSDPDVELFARVWRAAQSDFPALYEQRGRFGLDNGMTTLTDVATMGLPNRTKKISRQLIWEQVNDDLLGLLAGVIEWERTSNRHGLEQITAPVGVALGPVGRGLPEEVSASEVSQAVEAAIQLIRADDGSAVGVCTVLGGEQRTALTSSECLAQFDPQLRSDWTDRGDSIATTTSLQISGRRRGMREPVLAGHGTAISGRGVFLPTDDPADGSVAEATIEVVFGDGRFRLDRSAPPGSPVIDGATATVVGIVVSTTPCIAVGPSLIRAAVLAEQHSTVVPGELGPGIVIPIDVLAAGDPLPDQESVPDAEHTGGVEAQDWLDAVGADLQLVFPSLMFRDSRYDDADQDEQQVELAKSTDLSGRLLVGMFAKQLSVTTPWDVLAPNRDDDLVSHDDPLDTKGYGING